MRCHFLKVSPRQLQGADFIEQGQAALAYAGLATAELELEMTEACFNKDTAAPGKRPFHTLIPAFVTRSVGGRAQPYLSFGLMGGGMQAQGHVQFLLNHLVFGMDVQAAIDAARFRHLDGQRVAIEAPVGAPVRSALSAMGHVLVDERPVSFGGAQAIVRLAKGYGAGSDPRKDGMAVGY